MSDDTITIRPMTRDDAARVEAFAHALPPHDLLFLQRDIRNPRVVRAWLDQIEDGQIRSMIAVRAGEVVGTSALVRDAHSWSPHVADVRVTVAEAARGSGLGRSLVQHCIDQALASGVAKLTVRMTPDQAVARKVFEDLGFKPEALLRDQVRDAGGTAHDIVVYALDLDGWQARHAAYGFADIPAA